MSRRAAALLGLGLLAPATAPVAGQAGHARADLLLHGGMVHDGSWAPLRRADVAVTGGRIVFVGDADAARLAALDTLDVDGLLVAPGFIDMHSHAEVDADWGRQLLAFLHQGITTVVMGVDGGGDPDVAATLARWRRDGSGANALTYVGHGAVRSRVMGMAARAPSHEEQARMEALVRTAMEEGAFGLSTGLFYTPGSYAATEEVIALSRVAAEYGGIYDTHDRDLGAAYPGIGFLESIREGIRIGEESGARVIFSHFNPQGAHNYGRAPEGARLIDEARDRGVEVAAAQHPYTATQSNLRSYTIPDWAAAGGREAMLARFADPDTVAEIERQTLEMLAIRGGPEKIFFVDARPGLNGKTLAQVAAGWGMEAPAAARRILADGNASVMNLDLYELGNTRFLARQEWMMTCTDGRTPAPGQVASHPRPFGAFTRKLRLFALEEEAISLGFAIRSMTGLAADFLRLPDRGYVRPGAWADLVVLDRSRIRDAATYEDPQRYAEGTVHVLVNGALAIRGGRPTGVLAGVPLRRGGEVVR